MPRGQRPKQVLPRRGSQEIDHHPEKVPANRTKHVRALALRCLVRTVFDRLHGADRGKSRKPADSTQIAATASRERCARVIEAALCAAQRLISAEIREALEVSL